MFFALWTDSYFLHNLRSKNYFLHNPYLQSASLESVDTYAYTKMHSMMNSWSMAPYYAVIYPNLLIMSTIQQETRSSVQLGHDDRSSLQVTHCLISSSSVKFLQYWSGCVLLVYVSFLPASEYALLDV